MNGSRDVIQVVMLAALKPAFEEWLAERGLLLDEVSAERLEAMPPNFPTYIIYPHPDHVGDFMLGIQRIIDRRLDQA